MSFNPRFFLLFMPLTGNHFKTIGCTLVTCRFHCLAMFAGVNGIGQLFFSSITFFTSIFQTNCGVCTKCKEFFLTPKRYLSRQSFPPDGEISRYRPPLSAMRCPLIAALADRITVSVRGMIAIPRLWGYLIKEWSLYPQKYPLLLGGIAMHTIGLHRT